MDNIDSELENFYTEVQGFAFYKIRRTTKLEDIQYPKLVERLKPMYESKDPVPRRLATILNCAFTQGLVCFYLTKRILEDALKFDENSPVNSCNSLAYKELIYRCLESGILIKVKDATGSSAGVYKLGTEKFIKLIAVKEGEEIIKNREKNAILSWEKNEERKAENRDKKKSNFLETLEKMEGKNE